MRAVVTVVGTVVVALLTGVESASNVHVVQQSPRSVGAADVMSTGGGHRSGAINPPSDAPCDVLVAGGSTAALAAAIAAAEAGAPTLHVCLTEPTDRLGGQLAWNPAIDFGSLGETKAQGR